MDLSGLQSALDQISTEKSIPKDKIIEVLEKALGAAYRKEYTPGHHKIIAKLGDDLSEADVYIKKRVVDLEEVDKKPDNTQDESMEGLLDENRDPYLEKLEDINEEEKEINTFRPPRHISLEDAKEINNDAEPNDFVFLPLERKEDYGRIASQTAKQVMTQQIKEIERNIAYEEYKEKEGEIVSGIVQRKENDFVHLDLGKESGVLPPQEQLPDEYYAIGSRVRVLLSKVEPSSKGPVIFLSRASDKMLEKMFEIEIPEIGADVIEIKEIAREAGNRAKVAVTTNDPDIDPIGSCIGQKGTRIAAIINEFNGEKIDVIEWDEDPSVFISNALSPAEILNVELDEESQNAKVYVAEDQQSLTIGKEGQNVRLAAKLTGWKIDIQVEE